MNRSDLPRAIPVLEAAGFVHRHDAGITMFLDGPEASARDAVHVIFAGEKVRAEYALAAPSVSECVLIRDVRAISLLPLVCMKLTSNRDKDRTHVRDMLEIGLIDETWIEKLPPDLQPRLQELIDHPEG